MLQIKQYKMINLMRHLKLKVLNNHILQILNFKIIIFKLQNKVTQICKINNINFYYIFNKFIKIYIRNFKLTAIDHII